LNKPGASRGKGVNLLIEATPEMLVRNLGRKPVEMGVFFDFPEDFQNNATQFFFLASCQGHPMAHLPATRFLNL
jgi:hypothetical protein